MKRQSGLIRVVLLAGVLTVSALIALMANAPTVRAGELYQQTMSATPMMKQVVMIGARRNEGNRNQMDRLPLL